MNKYTKVKLGDVLQTTSGSTPLTTNKAYYAEGVVPWLTSGEVSQGKILFTKNKITHLALKETSVKLVPRESVVVAMYGATVGEVGILDFESTTNQAVCAILPNRTVANPYYIYYLLLHNKKRLIGLASGSARTNISQQIIKDFYIDLPDLLSQNKVAEALSIIDDKIYLNSKINAELEKTERLIYDYWFTQFDFPDDNGKPYKSSGGKMVYSPELNREIPKHWEAKKLTDLFEFEKGTEPGSAAYKEKKEADSDVKFFRVGDIDSESTLYIDGNKYKLKKVNPGDVVVTFDGTVGKMGISIDGAISGGLRHIYDKSGAIKNSTVWSIFRDPRTIATIQKYATGSVLLHASSSIEHLALAFNETIFTKYQEIVTPIYKQTVNNNIESAKLAELRDWLLPMLMNGQVTIKD